MNIRSILGRQVWHRFLFNRSKSHSLQLLIRLRSSASALSIGLNRRVRDSLLHQSNSNRYFNHLLIRYSHAQPVARRYSGNEEKEEMNDDLYPIINKNTNNIAHLIYQTTPPIPLAQKQVCNTSNNDTLTTNSPLSSPLFPSTLHKPKIIVSMSGGVDSSVSAYLCKEAGYDVTGIFMKNWDDSDEINQSVCTYTTDLRDMQNTCNHLKISSQEVNFTSSYWCQVFEPFLESEVAGFTPNPDVFCNRHIKFGALREWVDKYIGNITVATGHYARIQHVFSHNQEDMDIPFLQSDLSSSITASIDAAVEQLDPNHMNLSPLFTSSSILESKLVTSRLYRSRDTKKDQTYFLSLLTPSSLDKTLFPLGSLYKYQVRQIARALNLPTAAKSDSMGICMIGKRKFDSFLSSYIKLTKGYFITLDGIRVAEHKGLELYTIGQLAKIGGLSTKWYCAFKHIDTGDITIAPSALHPALLYDGLECSNGFSWIEGKIPNQLRKEGSMRVSVMVRSSGVSRTGIVYVHQTNNYDSRLNMPTNTLPPATTLSLSSDLSIDYIYTVRFENGPHHLICPGQICVLYTEDRDVCLGGGIISRGIDNYYQMKKDFSHDIGTIARE